MVDFAKAANEVFEALRTFDYTVSFYNDEGMKVTEPEEARRFYANSKNLEVSLIDDDDKSSINLRYGITTHANDVKGLMDTLRTIATKYNLIFSARQQNKQIKPMDSVTERKQDSRKMITSLTEGMYGTSRSSYLRLENARMIVRHSRRIDDSLIGARGRCVELIFIENAAGERFLFPSRHLAPARAMTEHVNQGGKFDDQVGGQVMRMTNEYANLAQASKFVKNNSANLNEGAMAIREACRSKMHKLQKTFERLSRPSSYTVECKDLTEKANMLNETGEEAIDETRVNELRQLLNGADLSKGVYECACKAMDEMKEERPITEEEETADWTPPVKKVNKILGRQVNPVAWEKFKSGELDLKGHPTIENPHFTSRYAELCYKLGGLIPVVQDDSLANLFQFVLGGFQDYTETGTVPTRSSIPTSQRGQMDAKLRQYLGNMVTIAKKALEAAHVPLTEGLADNNKVVREHMKWLNQFDANHVLLELGSMDPYSTLGGSIDSPFYNMDLGDAYEFAADQAIKDFDGSDFVDSPEMIDVLAGRNPQDPEENTISRDEIMSALRSYLQKWIEVHSVNLMMDLIPIH